MEGTCKLCGNEGSLEESHIVPKFIYRWLKKSSASGYLRFAENPNKRAQDGIKEYWLCPACEDRFEKWETQFSGKAFYPYLKESTFKSSYEDWMLKFSVSVTWRALTYIKDTLGIDYFPEEMQGHAQKAEEEWRAFLLGERPHPGKYEQHMLLLDAIESHTVPNLPATMNRYILRATDIDAVTNSSEAFVYCKFPKMAFFGFIHINKPRDWEGTKLHVQRGKFGQQRTVIPQAVGNYMMAQGEKMGTSLASISEKQDEVIAKALMKDIEKTANSASFEAMQHDVRLSGKKAFV